MNFGLSEINGKFYLIAKSFLGELKFPKLILDLTQIVQVLDAIPQLFARAIGITLINTMSLTTSINE